MAAQENKSILSPEIKEKFEGLYKKFVDSYLSTPNSEQHKTLPIKSKQEAIENFDQIKSAHKRGEDITDSVLKSFLPHRDTEYNRNRGAWIHIAPAINKDVKKWFENKGWISKSDWPDVAKAIFRFVSKCIDNSGSLKSECQTFLENPKIKGMQAGFLSPILNALDPDHFILVNSKPKDLINYLAGTSFTANLDDYPKINEVGIKIIDELKDVIAQANVPGLNSSSLLFATSQII